MTQNETLCHSVVNTRLEHVIGAFPAWVLFQYPVRELNLIIRNLHKPTGFFYSSIKLIKVAVTSIFVDGGLLQIIVNDAVVQILLDNGACI